MVRLPLLLLLVVSAGCRSGSASPSSPPPAVKVAKPEEGLYEQLRAGALQLSGVADTLESALAKVKAVPSGKEAAMKTGLADLADTIDSAGASIADYTDEPPAKAEVERRFAEMDERRIKAIDAANDALHDATEAESLATDLASEAKSDALGEVADLLDLAIGDLKDVIVALGGKVEAATEPG